MGAFFLISKVDGIDVAKAQRSARAHFAETGFSPPTTVHGPGFCLDIYGKIDGDGPQIVQFSATTSIACIGTLMYRGRTGREALAALNDEPDLEAALADCLGYFVLLEVTSARLRILRDATGSTEIYHDTASRVFSTSFLAVAKTVPDRRVNAHGVYEYVFYGVNLGTDTPFSAIRRLDLREMISSAGRGIEVRARDLAIVPPEVPLDEATACTVMLDLLKAELSAALQAFNGQVTQALSAGYDTRLLLATFRSIGFTPRLFVYGSDSDEDVVIAKLIARGENIPLDHINKGTSAPDPTPENLPETVARALLEYDGLVHHGVIWTGTEREARAERHAGGALNVHGGGGEVLRKMYRLVNSPTTTTWIAQCFYAQADPTICTGRFARSNYEAQIASKMQRLLGSPTEGISGGEAEALYPHFRLRAWFGRDNAINQRFGHGLLPFLDFAYITHALALPGRVKRFGNLQARMIRTAAPRIAAYPSGYGHNFSGPVPRRDALMEALTIIRPPTLRRGMLAFKQSRAQKFAKRGVLEDRLLSRVIDLGFPIMREFFQIDRVRDESHYQRIASLEYLFVAVDAGSVTDGADDFHAVA